MKKRRTVTVGMATSESFHTLSVGDRVIVVEDAGHNVVEGYRWRNALTEHFEVFIGSRGRVVGLGEALTTRFDHARVKLDDAARPRPCRLGRGQTLYIRMEHLRKLDLIEAIAELA